MHIWFVNTRKNMQLWINDINNYNREQMRVVKGVIKKFIIYCCLSKV